MTSCLRSSKKMTSFNDWLVDATKGFPVGKDVCLSREQFIAILTTAYELGLLNAFENESPYES